MKSHIFLLTLFLPMAATADSVNKWIDDQGKVHYGDKKAVEHIEGTKTIKIQDTYDQQSYEEGIERHKETSKIADDLEKERLQEEKLKAEENESKSSVPARPGGTAVAPNLSTRTLPIADRPLLPGHKPARLPVRK
jgi:hypothetical protein